MADFECIGAFVADKQHARALAERIVGRLPAVADFSVAGPGYINVKLLPTDVEQLVNQPVKVPTQTGKIVLDFGGPNVAKPMHVGHLRSLVIGDALQRILRYVGYDVISDIHLGDWGLQMGLLLVELKDYDKNDITLEVLEEAYPRAAGRAKEDPEFRKQAQQATERLQQRILNSDEHKLWTHFVHTSTHSVDRELAALRVVFQLFRGESDAQPLVATVIEDFKARGLAEESDGALVSRVTEPPIVLQNSEGAALYATTDIVTILQRCNEFYPDRIIYVVDQRQALHFEQVFTAVANIGYIGTDRLTHVGFGTVNGPGGKPLKTREGGVPKLHDLIQAAIEKAAEKNPEAAETVAVAALKFADLQNPRLSSYEFDLDRFLSFEGKTGPYLLYQCVRIKSILRGAQQGSEIVIGNEAERQIAVKLVFGFPEAIRKAVDKLSPKELVDHAYDLAQAFSKYYSNHTISGDQSRLALANLVLKQLETCLDLLGIEVPEKM